MKKLLKKCVAAYLAVSLVLSLVPVGLFVYAEDDWDDFDPSFLPPSAPAAPEPSYQQPQPSFYDPPPVYTTPEPEPTFTTPEPAPSFGTPSRIDDFDVFGTPAEVPTFESVAEPTTPDPSFFMDDSFTAKVDASSEGFIRIVRHPKSEISEYQNAVIEGLQVSVEQSATVENEITVTGYFIFRDRPTSFFYDINQKDNKLIFEFVDARTGTSPIAALDQAPIREIVIEEMQNDANRSIKGLNPEWHDVIRITFQLDHLPVISVTNEHNIISFSYKWTTDPEMIPQYVYKDKFPLVFWISGGTLGGIGIGVLTYFLMPKKEKVISNVLSKDDLPCRECR